MASDKPLGLNAIPRAVSFGKVAGLVYLVPKPELDHGYAVTKGVVEWATAIAELSGEKDTF